MNRIVLIIFILLQFSTLFAQNQEEYYLMAAEKFQGRRLVAEWEPAEYLVLAWKHYPEILGKMAHYAQDEGKVIILCSDSNQVRKFFRKHKYRTDKLIFFETTINSPWIRDYSPANIYSQGTSGLAFIDWLYKRQRKEDDIAPLKLAGFLNTKLLQLTMGDSGMVQVGGNLMTDGMATAFSSRLVLRDNLFSESDLKEYFKRNLGIEQYILFDTLPYDIIHHIDMHMKLINPTTLLVGKFPEGVSDAPYIERNIRRIAQNYKTAFGTDFQFVEIPMPDDYGRYPDSSGWADYLTYTNSLIFNKTVFVPQYDTPLDQMALDIYRANFPGYRIIGINTNEAISDGGALHCLSYTIPQKEAAYIWHTPPSNFSLLQTNADLFAIISSSHEVDKLKLYYRYKTHSAFKVKECKALTSSVFSCRIPVSADTDSLFYYFDARLENQKHIFLPITAPKGYFTVKRNKEVICT